MSERMKGKSVLVLGAASAGNMGQAIAARFAADGASVMVAGRDETELARFAGSINGIHRLCDITDRQQLEDLAAHAVSAFGRLDIAINATGLNQVKAFLDVTPEELRTVVDVQLVGTYQFLQAVLRRISDGGSIVTISSVSAASYLPDHVAYMATKAACDTMIRSLAIEFGIRGIRINSIAPGPTLDTPMAAGIMGDAANLARLTEKIPLGRIGTAADIAEAAVWLSDDNCFITGEVLQVNGGRAIPRLA